MADGNFIGSQIDGQHTCFSELSLQLIVNEAPRKARVLQVIYTEGPVSTLLHISQMVRTLGDR